MRIIKVKHSQETLGKESINSSKQNNNTDHSHFFEKSQFLKKKWPKNSLNF